MFQIFELVKPGSWKKKFFSKMFPLQKIDQNKSFVKNQSPECSLKKVFLKDFTKSTGKQLCWSLFFSKVSGLIPATLLKRRLQQRCFPTNFVKFFRTPFLQNTLWWFFHFAIHLTVSFCKEVLYIYSNQIC